MTEIADSLETRLARMEGQLSVYTETVTKCLVRLEKHTDSLEDDITSLKVSRGKMLGGLSVLSALVSGAVAIVMKYLSPGGS